MNKELKICLGLVVVALLGWSANQIINRENEKYVAKKFALEQQTAAVKAQHDLEIQRQKAITDLMVKQNQARETQRQQKQSEEIAARGEIQDQLKTVKVSSILLGSPNLAIINKKSYEEGGELALPNGRSLKVASIMADGVVLAYGGQTFQLALPVAKDIGGAAR